MPDNDARGRTHARDVAHQLWGFAYWIWHIKLTDLPPKGDFSDWITAGHTLDELEQIYRLAPVIDFSLPGEEPLVGDELHEQNRVTIDVEPSAVSSQPSAPSNQQPAPASVSSVSSVVNSVVTQPKAESRAPKARVTCLSDVRSQRVEWLWPGYIPLHAVTILDGDPGLGKSKLTFDIAARLSRGKPMPDASASDVPGAAGVISVHLGERFGPHRPPGA